MQRRKFLKGAALGAAASTLAAPAIAQSRKEIVIVSTWGRDFPGLGTSAQRLAERITEISEGRLVTQYYASGERVGAFDSFDHVASGEAQAYIGADYYWKGKHPGFAFYTSVPFGLTYTERAAWLKYKDGQELWDELAAEFNLKSLPCGCTGVQMGGWFNKEINTADDLKGLKMRIPGLGGDVLAKLGASPVSLPGSQIYENLVSGAIDATEWVGPWNDYFLKFYEAAKYYYWPGMHEPGGNIAFGFNKSFWESLSDWEKALLTSLSYEEYANQMDETNANNGLYLTKLVKEHGVELRRFSDEIYDAFGRAAAEVFDEMRQHSDLANRIYESWAAARQEIGTWMAVSDVAYSVQRNRVLGIGEGGTVAGVAAAGAACPPEVQALADAVRNLVGQ